VELADRKLFGTDGVRGVANTELTPELAFGLARAAGDGRGDHVVIGRDTRRSGPMLTSALSAGFNSVGVGTIDLGVIPVGAVSLLTRTTGAAFGVMVSASHNPAPDNGIKFFGSDGCKLSDAREADIEARYLSGEPWGTPVGIDIGSQTVMSGSAGRYIDAILPQRRSGATFPALVVDAANGAASEVASELFERMGVEVEVLNASPDGMNINLHCGATHPEALAEQSRGRVGFAFDGDADRLIAVDEDGRVANGDVIMAIFATWMKERGLLDNDAVVVTVMSNLGFHKAMEQAGIEVIETQVGDRYVLEAMQQSLAVVGGEQSGHVLLEDRATGDGLRTAIRLLEVMAASGKELRELRRVMDEYPQVLDNVRVADKRFADNEAIGAAILDGERALAGQGRILVRASGTEPLIRVMVEAPVEQEAGAVASSIADVVRAELG